MHTSAWTVEHGDDYRNKYDTLSFKKVQKIIDDILKVYFQKGKYPSYLISCIMQIKSSLRVAELGGYNGFHALTTMQSLPKARITSWINYDLSRIAKKLTKKALKNYPYKFKLLNKPFYEESTDPADLFYSSKTLEHMRLQEAKDCISHMSNCRFQVHIVDWFKADDTHVIEDNSHEALIKHFKFLGYNIVDAQDHGFCSLLFAERKQ